MKKTMFAVAIASMSTVAMAADPIVFSSGNKSVDPLSECPMLANAVTLGVSSKVHGGFTCDETSNVVKVAACHEGGSRTTGVLCAYIDLNTPTTPNDPTDDVLNSQGCTADMVTAGLYSTIPNYTAFTSTSAGGSMIGVELTGRCGDASLKAINFW